MRYSKIWSPFLFLCLVLIGKSAVVQSEHTNFRNTIVEIPKISGKIMVDGVLNEHEWNSAAIIQRFYNAQNAEPENTDIKVAALYDESYLYFSIKMPKPEIEPNQKKCFLSSEWDLRVVPNVSIHLEPEHFHGVYYRFIVDAWGNKQDLRIDDESWSAEWLVNTKETDGKVFAEVQIPVSGFAKRIADGEIWGFNITVDGQGDNTLSSTPIKWKLADARNFGHLIFKGNLGEAQLKNIENDLPEFHKDQEETKLADNKKMCGPEFVQMDGELANFMIGSEYVMKNGRVLKCIGLDNEAVVRSNYPFFYEKYENKQLQRLRKLYQLDEVVATGKNDFEKLLLLNEWLYTHVPFGSPPPIRPDALHVLEYGLNDQPFYCTFLSFALMQMYSSIGYTARKITSVGHGTLDVWSDYWQKWIQIDPSRHSFFRLAKTAVPLNSNEIRREYWKNGGVDMEMVFGTEQRAERVTLETRDKDGLMRYRTDGYQWIAYKSRNNFFEVPFAYWNYDYLIVEDEYDANITWMTGDNTDIREILGTRTDRMGDVFWTLNQACIHLYDSGSDELSVQLETVTPNFETFEIAVDNGEWEKCNPVFSWKLHKGQNFLQARSVNKFGVKGHEHKIVLKVE